MTVSTTDRDPLVKGWREKRSEFVRKIESAPSSSGDRRRPTSGRGWIGDRQTIEREQAEDRHRRGLAGLGGDAERVGNADRGVRSAFDLGDQTSIQNTATRQHEPGGAWDAAVVAAGVDGADDRRGHGAVKGREPVRRRGRGPGRSRWRVIGAHHRRRRSGPPVKQLARSSLAVDRPPARRAFRSSPPRHRRRRGSRAARRPRRRGGDCRGSSRSLRRRRRGRHRRRTVPVAG